tara:strand:+ start:80 stop:265 length:186 start_codon:yes stop_codon:yes gene_type:complete
MIITKQIQFSKSWNLYSVTFYDEDGDLFDEIIPAPNENYLIDILDVHENDVADYMLIEEDK